MSRAQEVRIAKRQAKLYTQRQLSQIAQGFAGTHKRREKEEAGPRCSEGQYPRNSELVKSQTNGFDKSGRWGIQSS